MIAKLRWINTLRTVPNQLECKIK